MCANSTVEILSRLLIPQMLCLPFTTHCIRDHNSDIFQLLRTYQLAVYSVEVFSPWSCFEMHSGFGCVGTMTVQLKPIQHDGGKKLGISEDWSMRHGNDSKPPFELTQKH